MSRIIAKDKKLDRHLRGSFGYLYGKEISTLILDEMKRAQILIDYNWNQFRSSKVVSRRSIEDYILIKSSVNWNLQTRGAM